MKKVFLLGLLFICATRTIAQKYMLLDSKISLPVIYTDKITPLEKSKGYFPVEKKEVRKFLNILGEISKQLSEKNTKAKEYELGCIKFKGVTFQLARGNKIDYVITSTCDSLRVTMHLCDGKLGNEANEYFVNTWIKYIEAAYK